MIDRERWNRLSGPLIWLLVGFGVLWLVGNGSLDLREWNPLRTVPPPTTIERIARMRLEFVQGNWQAALAQSKALRNDLPDDPERMRIEAGCLLRLGRAKESADVLRRLMDKDGNDMNVRLALALALMQSGSAEEARTVLEMVRRHPVATAEIRDQAMGLLVRLDGLEPLQDSGSGPVTVDETQKKVRSRRDDQSIVDALDGFGSLDSQGGTTTDVPQERTEGAESEDGGRISGPSDSEQSSEPGAMPGDDSRIVPGDSRGVGGADRERAGAGSDR